MRFIELSLVIGGVVHIAPQYITRMTTSLHGNTELKILGDTHETLVKEGVGTILDLIDGKEPPE